MARPRKSGLDYFSHDVNASSDPKLEPVIMRYGAAGYAFYFMHLEYCYRSDDLSIDISAAETGQEMREVIQRKLRIDDDEYENILQSLLRHGAFDSEIYTKTGKLTSNGIKKRAAKVLEKRERETSRYKNISAAETPTETTAETPQIKEKKSKVNIPPISPKRGNEYSALFLTFWEAYPKKQARKVAYKAFQKINPDATLLNSMLETLERQKRSKDWQKEGGQYIPQPSAWLNGRRWEDETIGQEMDNDVDEYEDLP